MVNEINIKIISVAQFRNLFAVFIFLVLFVDSALGQTETKDKDVINITSSFKPSIIRIGKIEFYADPLQKDSGSYQFSYPELDIPYSTNLTTFVIRPLAFSVNDHLDSSGVFVAKLGFGNYRTPFASIGYQHTQSNNSYSVNFDHLSSKGNLSEQQYSNSRLGFGMVSKIRGSKYLGFSAGYDDQSYRLYGFDHRLFSFTKDQLLQHFKRISLTTVFESKNTENAVFSFLPKLNMSYLMASRNTDEFLFDLNLRLAYRKRKQLSFSVEPSYTGVYLNQAQLKKISSLLLKMPLRGYYTNNRFSIHLGINPALAGNEKLLLPDFRLNHRIPGSGVDIFAALDNKFELNSYHSLYGVNPFVLSPDTLTIGRSTNYHIGVSHDTKIGFHFTFKAGWLSLKNQPLFTNFGISGKDFRTLIESSVGAISVESQLKYNRSDKFDIGADFKFYSFNNQTTFSDMYGWLPFEGTLQVNWKPISRLTTKLKTKTWTGASGRTQTGSDIKLEGAIDINVGADYEINKSWSIWLDLNNIANNQYQRWNQYQVIGFNAIVGFRYTLH